jgi:hypothetical protein
LQPEQLPRLHEDLAAPPLDPPALDDAPPIPKTEKRRRTLRAPQDGQATFSEGFRTSTSNRDRHFSHVNS